MSQVLTTCQIARAAKELAANNRKDLARIVEDKAKKAIDKGHFQVWPCACRRRCEIGNHELAMLLMEAPSLLAILESNPPTS